MDKRYLGKIVYRASLSLLGFGVAGCLFLYPAGRVIYEITRPGLSEGEIPPLAATVHQRLAPRFERWAKDRVASGRAAELTTGDLVETEWPVFGTVFFLWATESLQEAWEHDPSLSKEAPKDYSAGAIDAAAALLVDPNHATWVKDHWGEEYLHRENAFYRMLLIGGLSAHFNLTDDPKYLDVIRDQVDTLTAEIDASESGLLYDYPGECYPSDVLAAIVCIRRADAILGTDHSAFAARAIRGFQGKSVDDFGLVPFMAFPPTGEPLGTSRGCSNSYVSLVAPELWPVQAKMWYDRYQEHFWEEGLIVCGFREYPRSEEAHEWHYSDMDAGPVIAGLGMAASAFGVGAARVNGRFDHAYPLAAEMIATSWPLPDGTLLMPRLLSNATDAPYLGEACIVYNLTRRPAEGVTIITGGSIPLLAYGFLAFYLAVGLLTVWLSFRELRYVVEQLRENVL